MKRYLVTYDFASYEYEHTVVYAGNKGEVRKIMRREVGSNVKIRDIEEVTL